MNRTENEINTLLKKIDGNKRSLYWLLQSIKTMQSLTKTKSLNEKDRKKYKNELKKSEKEVINLLISS